METDEAARGAIRDNIEALGLFGQTRIQRRDAIDLGPMPASAAPPYDLAFLDPPYARGLGEKALAQILAHGWLKAGAAVVFERGADEPVVDFDGFDLVDERTYGAARILFLKAVEA